MIFFLTPKRFLVLLLLTATLAACRADQTPPSPAPVAESPASLSATPPAGVETDCPRLSATQTGIAPATQTAEALFATLAAIHTQTAQAPTVTPSPTEQESGFGWCAEGVVSCFADGYSFPLQRPIPSGIDPTYRYASSQNGDREIHHGVEFYQAFGTPVLAAAEGRVVFAGDDMDANVALWPGFYGNYIILMHDFGGQPLYTLYGHLSRVDVGISQVVEAGQEIGLVGASGSAIGSHLHFEVRFGQSSYASTRNPELWFAPLEGMGALAGRIFDPDNPKVSGEVRIQRMEAGKIADFPAYLPMNIYPPELARENSENFALNDLPAGQYRLTYLYGGAVYEHFIEIQPGILTLVNIVLD